MLIILIWWYFFFYYKLLSNFIFNNLSSQTPLLILVYALGVGMSLHVSLKAICSYYIFTSHLSYYIIYFCLGWCFSEQPGAVWSFLWNIKESITALGLKKREVGENAMMSLHWQHVLCKEMFDVIDSHMLHEINHLKNQERKIL